MVNSACAGSPILKAQETLRRLIDETLLVCSTWPDGVWRGSGGDNRRRNALVTGQGIGQDIGKVVISETPYGLLFTPSLKALPAGVHGFHVHEKGSCEPGMKDGKAVAALAAGGHFDPQKTGKHLGPYADGHLGDLPAIYVTADGMANYPVLAPRLKKSVTLRARR